MCWAWAGELPGETLTRCHVFSKALAEAARVPGRVYEDSWRTLHLLGETWSLRLLSLESSHYYLSFGLNLMWSGLEPLFGEVYMGDRLRCPSLFFL